ncbi:GMC family oxidoreductase N-terminal domain-containing protein [Deltaproteobacteria bacterium]|nr:GMC family oxidoreductase N-terminal domain-containing protein [Deltaproteobacteria bacterium]
MPILSSNDYTKQHYHCQYLVIGSGPGGSVSSALLAEAGKNVILLEEGKYYDHRTFSTNTSKMTSQLYRNGGVFPFLGLPTVAFAEGCCVGGGSTINGGLLWRTPQNILRDWETKYKIKGYDNENLKQHFSTIEQDLHVIKHQVEKDSNIDSLLLKEGAELLNWETEMAPRAIKDCVNENLCATGCISGSKQSMLNTYIPRALAKGATLFTECRAIRICCAKNKAKKIIVKNNNQNKKFEISFDHLVLAGGAIQTPHLLRKSKISKLAGQNLQFHMNLKIVALFDKKIKAEQGTIFTVQVQEFMNEGILIMASNLNRTYLSMTLSHQKNHIINHVLDNYDKSAIYAAMIKPYSIAHIISCFGDKPLVWYSFNQKDLETIRNALLKTGTVLFKSGAVELYLPVKGMPVIKSLAELEQQVCHLSVSKLELISVHAMASCPMGVSPDNSVVNCNGELWNMQNILITDASVLPTNIGESPQGTLMAFAHEIINRHLLI